MSPLDAFSPDYATARDRFRAMVAERGWEQITHSIDAPGFNPGELTIDVACFGVSEATRVLVLSSGLHGGEGFFGSAVQLAWLASLPPGWQPPPGTGVVLLHALNPYGFAMIRRANEENVDLNRNFLLPDQFPVLAGKTRPLFAPLDSWLNPTRAPGRINWFFVQFPWMALRYGLKYLREVMPAGQYSFPKGIFYGGTGQCQTTRFVIERLPLLIGSADRVIHLDYHTGLGRYGQFNLLSSDPVGSERMLDAVQLFGPDRVKFDNDAEDGYHNYGDIGEWLSRQHAKRQYIYLCAEFGTFDSTRVIGTLRRENMAHHFLDRSHPRYAAIKHRAIDTFAPFDPVWRAKVIQQSVELNQQALTLCAE